MTRGRQLPARPQPIRPDLSKYPLVMTKQHLAEVFGRSVRWVEKHLAAGTFPIPRLAQYKAAPAWSKGRVVQFFEQETFEPMERSA